MEQNKKPKKMEQNKKPKKIERNKKQKEMERKKNGMKLKKGKSIKEARFLEALFEELSGRKYPNEDPSLFS